MEFNWDDSSLSIEPSVEGPTIKITGKACGPSGIVIEMIKAGCDAMLDVITDLINLIIKEEQIPDDWDQSTIINCFKGKSNQR